MSVMGFFQRSHVLPSLQAEVLSYYEHLWSKAQGLSVHQLPTDLPAGLRTELALSVSEHILRKIPAFKRAEKGFLPALALKLQPCTFLREQDLVQSGDVDVDLFLIAQGSVAVDNLQDVSSARENAERGRGNPHQFLTKEVHPLRALLVFRPQ